MSEKDANDNTYSVDNGNDSEAAQALPDEEKSISESLNLILDENTKREENDPLDWDSCLPPYESPLKKEENPFSFKKFLNQDSGQKNKGARKKIFTSPTNSDCYDKSGLSNPMPNRVPADMNSRISASDMSSVLPDFVQDHLVIEQCYLSGSSPDIDINNLNLQNLPDLNLQHRNVHFMLNENRNSGGHSSNTSPSSNLPDFTLGANNFQSASQNIGKSKRLPDFALHARNDDIDLGVSRRSELNNTNDTSQVCRQRIQISSSPSVPLDLPSYESDEAKQNLPMPFDLTAPAEEKSGGCRGRTSNDSVSKSLPDFLSDGPIKKELNENLQNVRGIINSTQNGPSLENHSRAEDRLHREIDSLRSQLVEKNRRLQRLEKELELIHSTDQRETASLEYALQEVENNLKQTAERALNAEKLVMKLKQENKALKSEISLLRSENVSLKLGNYESQMSPSQQVMNQKLAKELKSAASQAENSLRSLLIGVENLRAVANTLENSHKFEDPSENFTDFSNEDLASGPAP